MLRAKNVVKKADETNVSVIDDKMKKNNKLMYKRSKKQNWDNKKSNYRFIKERLVTHIGNGPVSCVNTLGCVTEQKCWFL